MSCLICKGWLFSENEAQCAALRSTPNLVECAMSMSQVVVSLKTQYRMAEDIQLLANALIYNDRLKCGTEAISSQALATDLQDNSDFPSWILKVREIILACRKALTFTAKQGLQSHDLSQPVSSKCLMATSPNQPS